MWAYVLLALLQFSLWFQLVVSPCYKRFLAVTCTPLALHSGRHVGLPARPRKFYSSSTLKAIRKITSPSRLPDDLWMKLKDLGIRKPVRSKRKRKLNRSTNTDLGRVRLSTCSIPSTPAILMANVRSLRPKMDELHAVVSVTKPEIICLTETWLNINIPDSAIQLGNYACMRRDRPDGQCGGVCVYVDSHLPCT